MVFGRNKNEKQKEERQILESEPWAQLDLEREWILDTPIGDDLEQVLLDGRVPYFESEPLRTIWLAVHLLAREDDVWGRISKDTKEMRKELNEGLDRLENVSKTVLPRSKEAKERSNKALDMAEESKDKVRTLEEGFEGLKEEKKKEIDEEIERIEGKANRKVNRELESFKEERKEKLEELEEKSNEKLKEIRQEAQSEIDQEAQSVKSSLEEGLSELTEKRIQEETEDLRKEISRTSKDLSAAFDKFDRMHAELEEIKQSKQEIEDQLKAQRNDFYYLVSNAEELVKVKETFNKDYALKALRRRELDEVCSEEKDLEEEGTEQTETTEVTEKEVFLCPDCGIERDTKKAVVQHHNAKEDEAHSAQITKEEVLTEK